MTKTKTRLNLELAQVLAQKEYYVHNASKDFGRLLAARQIDKTENDKVRRRKSAGTLERLLEVTLFDRNFMR